MIADPAVIGAFLSGIGAVLGSSWAIKRTRREDEENCEKRIAMLREGIRIGRDEDVE